MTRGLTHVPIEQLPTGMREKRLRLLVDELRFERDGLKAHVASLRGQVDRKNARLTVIRAEQAELREQLRLALRELAKAKV